MNKMERVRAALRCDTVDRPPYSFWTHFPGIDLDPVRLAQSTITFARELDLDFVKAMPNGQFCTEDWGVVSDFSDDFRATQRFLRNCRCFLCVIIVIFNDGHHLLVARLLIGFDCLHAFTFSCFRVYW